MWIWQLSLVIPNSPLLQKYEATFALWMIFLLGRQAILGLEPPTYFRSMTTARIPFLARVQAMYFACFAAAQHDDIVLFRSGCLHSYLGTKKAISVFFCAIPVGKLSKSRSQDSRIRKRRLQS